MGFFFVEVFSQLSGSKSLSLPFASGVVTDRGLPAAAADAGGGCVAPVEGARAEV